MFAVTRARKEEYRELSEEEASPGKQAAKEEESFVLWEASNPPPNIQVSIDEQLIKDFIEGYRTDTSFKDKWKDTPGRPTLGSILSSLYNKHVMDKPLHNLQETNDRFLANIQRNGTFSVIPRVSAG